LDALVTRTTGNASETRDACQPPSRTHRERDGRAGAVLPHQLAALSRFPTRPRGNATVGSFLGFPHAPNGLLGEIVSPRAISSSEMRSDSSSRAFAGIHRVEILDLSAASRSTTSPRGGRSESSFNSPLLDARLSTFIDSIVSLRVEQQTRLTGSAPESLRRRLTRITARASQLRLYEAFGRRSGTSG